MSKELKKFNSMEELNAWLSEGKVIYSVANAGTIWFVEYEESTVSANTKSNSKTIFDLLDQFEKLGYISKRPSGDYRNISASDTRCIINSIIFEDESLQSEIVGFLDKYSYMTRTEIADAMKR